MTEDPKLAVALDYETYYSSKDGYSLTNMGPTQYCADPRFDPYLVAICGWEIADDGMWPCWKTGETDTKFTTDGSMFRKLPDGRQLYVGRPENFRNWKNLEHRTLCCHNAGFDEIATLECQKRGIVPRLDGVRWVCTADLSAFLMFPRNLKGAMKYMFGKEISKAVRAGLDGRHDWELDAKDRMDLVEYGGSDAIECHDIWIEYSSEWPEIERLISSQNREAIRRGVRVDVEYAKAALKELKSYQAKVILDIPWATQINPKTKEFYAVGSLPALRQAVVDLGVKPPATFAKNSPEFLDWLKEHDDIPFIRTRQVAVALSMHIARIEGILKSLDPQGNAHPSFLYFAAHTGRFSGKSDTSGANINMLNMPRKPIFHGDPNVFGGKGVDIRGMYVARPGYKFAVYDFSQIEARFALWLVGDTHMMEAMKREGNLYQANAVEMGWCKSGENIKKNDPDKYRLAKCCLHGDTPVLVRSEKRNGSLTSPYYKRIIHVTSTDRVWDGHEWVRHLGVEKMKEVKNEELIEVGGVCLTRDHKVYISDTESRRADSLLGDEQAAAMAWGDAHNPVRGWAHVRILAAYLAGACARALYLGAREALHILACALHLHGVRRGDDTHVGQRSQGSNDEVREVRAQGVQEEGRGEHVGEGAR